MEIGTHEEKYAMFKKKQEELSDMLKESSEIIASLKMEHYKENLEKLGDKVHNETFKIMVVGTFKNGKSTFINSFLGEEILPAYAVPCTAVINEVKYGKEKRAILHFRSPLPEQMQKGIPAKTLAHMKKYDMKDIPPLEIPYNEIEDYAVIPMGKDPAEILLESPYEKIELFWPLPLLENGVEIIDSPGLNEAGTRTRVTVEYLANADAILFVLDAATLCAQNEMEFIENNLKTQGFDDPFFVVNRFDLIRQRERAQVRQFAEVKLKGYSTNDIYFLSARDALDGKLDNDMDLYENSGMPEFEKALSLYLTKNKGKAKLVQPSKELKRILTYEAKDRVIPMQKKILATSLEEVKEEYEKAKPKFERLKIRKDQIHDKLLLSIERNKPEIRSMAEQNIKNLENIIPEWLENYIPQTDIGLVPSQERTKTVVNEMLAFVNNSIEKHQIEWRAKVLQPFTQEKAIQIFEAVEPDMSIVLEELDNIGISFQGGEVAVKSAVPTWQRVVGAAGGVLMGDLGLAVSGGVNGIGKDMAKTFAFEFGAGIVMAMLGIATPAAMGAVVLAACFGNLKNNQASALKTAKKQVVATVTQNLSVTREEMIQSIVNSLGNMFQTTAKQIVDTMDAEIEDAENQIKSIIEEMEKGEENVEKELESITECEEKINSLSKRLDDMIFQLLDE